MPPDSPMGRTRDGRKKATKTCGAGLSQLEMSDKDTAIFSLFPSKPIAKEENVTTKSGAAKTLWGAEITSHFELLSRVSSPFPCRHAAQKGAAQKSRAQGKAAFLTPLNTKSGLTGKEHIGRYAND